MQREFGVYKSPANMTKEERLRLGAALLERKERLLQTKEEILKNQKRELHPVNVYDVEIVGGDTARANSLTAAECEAFTPAMKDAALLRWRALYKLMSSFVDEQLAEIERELSSL